VKQQKKSPSALTHGLYSIDYPQMYPSFLTD